MSLVGGKPTGGEDLEALVKRAKGVYLTIRKELEAMPPDGTGAAAQQHPNPPPPPAANNQPNIRQVASVTPANGAPQPVPQGVADRTLLALNNTQNDALQASLAAGAATNNNGNNNATTTQRARGETVSSFPPSHHNAPSSAERGENAPGTNQNPVGRESPPPPPPQSNNNNNNQSNNNGTTSPVVPEDIETSRIPLPLQSAMEEAMDYLQKDAEAAARAGGDTRPPAFAQARTFFLRSIFSLTGHRAMRRKVVERGLLGALVRLLRCTEGDNVVVLNDSIIVATLANLVFEENAKHEMMKQHDGAELFVRLLRMTNVSILAHAARGVFSLTTIYEYKEQFSKAIPHLVQCLRHECEIVVINAAGAIANIAIHPDNKVPLVQAGALPPLIELGFQSATSPILHQTARCLFSLAANRENRTEMVKMDVLRLFRSLFERQNLDEEIKANAVGALGNISMTESAAQDPEYLAVLRPMLGSKNVSLCRQLVRVIYSFSARPQVKQIFSHPDALRNFVEMLKYVDDVNTKRDAAGTLANLIIGEQPFKQIVIDHQGFDPVIATLKLPVPTTLKNNASSTPTNYASSLSAVAGGNANNTAVVSFNEMIGQVVRLAFALVSTDTAKELFVSKGGVDALVSVANRDMECTKNAMGALANVSTQCPHQVIKAGALPLVVQCIFSDTSHEARRQAARALSILTLCCAPESNGQGIEFSPFLQVRYGGIRGEAHRRKHDYRVLFESVNAGGLRSGGTMGSSSATGAGNGGLRPGTSELVAAVKEVGGFDGFADLDSNNNGSFPSGANPYTSSLSRPLAQASRSSSLVSSFNATGAPESREEARSPSLVEPMLSPISSPPMHPPHFDSFILHDFILEARCPKLYALVSTSANNRRSPSTTTTTTPEWSDAGKTQEAKEERARLEALRVTPRHRASWLALFEYIYTAGLLHNHVKVFKNSLEALCDLEELAVGFELPRLAAFAKSLKYSHHRVSSSSSSSSRATGSAASVVQHSTAAWSTAGGQSVPTGGTLPSIQQQQQQQQQQKFEARAMIENDEDDEDDVEVTEFGPLPTSASAAGAPASSSSSWGLAVAGSPVQNASGSGSSGGAVGEGESAAARAATSPTAPSSVSSAPAAVRGLPPCTWESDMCSALAGRKGDVIIVPTGFATMEDPNSECEESDNPLCRAWVAEWASVVPASASSRSSSQTGEDAGFASPEKRAAVGEERQFRAHRHVLCARSAYFKSVFEQSWGGTEKEVVRVNTSASVLAVMLRFMYCGFEPTLAEVLRSDPELALRVLIASHEYSVEGLQFRCEAILAEFVDDTNVFEILREICLIQAPALYFFCLHLVVTEAPLFARVEELKAFSNDLYENAVKLAERWGISHGMGTVKTTRVEGGGVLLDSTTSTTTSTSTPAEEGASVRVGERRREREEEVTNDNVKRQRV